MNSVSPDPHSPLAAAKLLECGDSSPLSLAATGRGEQHTADESAAEKAGPSSRTTKFSQTKRAGTRPALLRRSEITLTKSSIHSYEMLTNPSLAVLVRGTENCFSIFSRKQGPEL